MKNPIDVLMDEHRDIEQVLGSLETLALGIEHGLVPERRLVAGFGTFFAEFADARHHGKEEDILFQRMAGYGFPRNGGPVGVMLIEHDEGRAHVRAIREVGGGAGDLRREELHLLRTEALGFVPLLRQHILKEDHVLYPMALRVMQPGDLERMAESFDTFDRRGREDGSFDRQQELLERLVSTFRPDPVRMAAAARMGHCGAR